MTLDDEHGRHGWLESGADAEAESDLGGAPALDASELAYADDDRTQRGRAIAEAEDSPAAGEWWEVREGDPLVAVDRLPGHSHSSFAVAFGDGELVVDCGERLRLGTPAGRRSGAAGGRPCASLVVLLDVRSATIGHGELHRRWLLVLGEKAEVVARFDYSPYVPGKGGQHHWEMDFDGIRRLCTAAGLAFEEHDYAGMDELLDEHPGWVEPETEFDAVHVDAEDAREWAHFVELAVALAFFLGGVGLAAGTPIAPVYGALIAAAGVVYGVLTHWAAQPAADESGPGPPARRRTRSAQVGVSGALS